MNTQQARKIQPVAYKFERKVKESVAQTKKHWSQFSDTERILLECCVNNLSNNYITVSEHAKTHIPFFNHHFAKDVLNSCDIIEFNVTQRQDIQCRVLVRSKKTFPIKENGCTKQGNICMVVELKTCRVISTYANYADDTHSSINMSRYDGELNILKFA